MNPYNHQKIEKKWRKVWDDNKVYQTLNAAKAKAKKLKPFYVLDMFPYPSGSGLHVGHPRGYIASDVFARMKRMQGYNVLHPMGFDSFGLPAEQYAIKTGKNPGTFTNQLVKHYREQLSILGFSFDWDRQVATHDPEYYKWTQWIFLKIYNSYYDHEKQKARPIADLIKKFEKTDKNWKKLSQVEKEKVLMNYRLAYEGFSEVNWCPELGTVLANDEVIQKDGKMVSERGEFPVEKKSMRQWFMRITVYADRLIDGLDTIDWPNNIKEIQKNWIGKSEGSEIDFKITSQKEKYLIFDFDGVLGNTLQESLEAIVVMGQCKTKEEAFETSIFPYLNNKPRHHRGAEQHHIDSNNDWTFKFGAILARLKPKIFGEFVREIAKISDAKIAIVSSGSNDYILPMVEEIKKLGVHPTHVLTLQDHHSKEEKIETICRDWGVSEKDIYYFTDSKGDIYELEGICDKNKLIGCAWGHIGAEPLLELIPEKQLLRNWDDIHNLWSDRKVSVFTTRADTLFGCTYIVLAPEHPLIADLKHSIKNWNHVAQYIQEVKSKSDEDRAAAKEKTGVELHGVFAINPANGEQVPVWIADYVLANYGTGAVMAVPAHDERDFEFAKKYDLPIRKVIQPKKDERVFYLVKSLVSDWQVQLDQKNIKWERFEDWGVVIFVSAEDLGGFIPFGQQLLQDGPWYYDVDGEKELIIFKDKIFDAFVDSVEDMVAFGRIKNIPEAQLEFHKWYVKAQIVEGFLVNSGKFTSMTSDQARKAITEFVGGKLVTKYKMRDAIFARQRYWGEPIPLRHVAHGSAGHSSDTIIEPLSEKELPLKLPNVKSYTPSGTGESPLATVSSWVKSGYETNTMPGWAGSSWYFLRYMDPKNKKEFAGKNEIAYWGDVDMYVGGAEHATGHLLYSRFWNKVLKDLGYVKQEEPFKALRNQGMILGADGVKMSKRYGNVVNPDDVVRDLGADTLRVYEAFMGPFEGTLPWSTDGIVGARRFVEKVWRLASKIQDTKTKIQTNTTLQKTLHKTIKKVTDDIANFSFNTAISAMMICTNEMEKSESISVDDFKKFLQILAPFAPHVCEELWGGLGEKKSIHLSDWPKYNPKLIIDDTVKLGVQVNGKVRAEIELAKDVLEADVKNMVMQIPDVIKWLDGREVKKFIYIPGKIISIVA